MAATAGDAHRIAREVFAWHRAAAHVTLSARSHARMCGSWPRQTSTDNTGVARTLHLFLVYKLDSSASAIR